MEAVATAVGSTQPITKFLGEPLVGKHQASECVSFFLITYFLKVFTEFVTMVLLLFMFWIFGHDACETLVPQSEDQTHTACTGR